MQLFHQRAMVVLEAKEIGGCAARGEVPLQPLDQQGAVSVEPLEPAQVDVDALDRRTRAQVLIDQLFEPAGLDRGPGAGAGKSEPLAFGDAFEQNVTHANGLWFRLTSNVEAPAGWAGFGQKPPPSANQADPARTACGDLPLDRRAEVRKHT